MLSAIKFKSPLTSPNQTGPYLPARATTSSSGYDLHYYNSLHQDNSLHQSNQLNDYFTIYPGETKLVPTGLVVADIIGDVDISIRPRSGLSSRGIVAILGTIDVDYRGEIKVIMINLSDKIVRFSPGDRIAQLVINPIVYPAMEFADDSTETERQGGFGSTGI